MADHQETVCSCRGTARSPQTWFPNPKTAGERGARGLPDYLDWSNQRKQRLSPDSSRWPIAFALSFVVLHGRCACGAFVGEHQLKCGLKVLMVILGISSWHR